jgi:mono/diheme cytochrome c family protein
LYTFENISIMKKAFKIIGYLLLGLVALLLCVAAYIQFSPMPTYEVKAPDLKITPDSARLAEGRRIAMTMCVHCHRGTDGKLSGDIWNDDDEFGKLWSANLTQHPDAGIGRYTEGELAHTLRTGIKRDGHFAGPFMIFRNLSDEDLSAVIAFLRSDAPEVQPSERRQPPSQPTFLAKMWYKLLIKPMPYPQQPVVAPPPSDKLAYGRYLVNGKWECFGCHSAGFETNNIEEPEKSKGYLAGGNPLKDAHGNSAVSANITPDRETGIGAWTEAQFAETVRFGKRPDGKSLNPLMPPMTVLTDVEISAIWAYLQTVPPIKNTVTRTLEASGH